MVSPFECHNEILIGPAACRSASVGMLTAALTVRMIVSEATAPSESSTSTVMVYFPALVVE